MSTIVCLSNLNEQDINTVQFLSSDNTVLAINGRKFRYALKFDTEFLMTFPMEILKIGLKNHYENMPI